MKIVLLGSPGAGKGTQAVMFAKAYGIPHISTGEILRKSIANKSSVGLKAEVYVAAGKLVPDQVMVDLIDECLQNDDAQRGYILDGFPRNLLQMERFSIALKKRNDSIDYFIYIQLDNSVVRKRLLERANKEFRGDDIPEIIDSRLVTFEKYTLPMIEYIKEQMREKCIIVEGNASPQAVNKSIIEKLQKDK